MPQTQLERETTTLKLKSEVFGLATKHHLYVEKLLFVFLFISVVPNITSYLPAGSSRYIINVTDDIIFQCTATGVPPPDIQWYRGNDLLNSSNDRITIGNLSVDESERNTVTRELILSQTSLSDASNNYSCRATNAADGGLDSEVFELYVQGWKKIIAQKLQS